jgi:hypothetical protein
MNSRYKNNSLEILYQQNFIKIIKITQEIKKMKKTSYHYTSNLFRVKYNHTKRQANLLIYLLMSNLYKKRRKTLI